MSHWNSEQLQRFATLDDFRVAPFREDGKTYGTPTFIWSVVADDALYIRPYFGESSRWYRAALSQGGGRARIGGVDHEVAFVPAASETFDAVDDAYRAKYSNSPYLAPMIADGPRSTTLRVAPAE